MASPVIFGYDTTASSDVSCVVVWGTPLFSFAMFLSMLVATITSIIESIGDYYAAARMCVVSPPPSHAVNRGIAVEGLGGVLCGLFGAGNGTTSYSGQTALIRLTGVITVLASHHRYHLSCAERSKRNKNR